MRGESRLVTWTRSPVGWFILAISLSLACAGVIDSSEDGVPQPIVVDGWRRAEHHGLILYTDVPETTAHRVFRRLNRFLDVVSLRVNARPFEANGRLEVFVFGARREYLRFAPEQIGGHASRRDGWNMAALSVEQVFEGTGTLYHELTHLVLNNDPYRRFPSWYHEGLAVFFSTSVLRGDVLTVGGLSHEALEEIRAKRPMRLRVLLSSPVWGQRDAGLYYADAWAFVHFGLLSQALGGPDRRTEFATFVSRVSQGNPWESTFLAAFGASPEVVEKEFRRHRGKLAQMEVLTLANITVDLDESAIVFESVEPVEIAHELARLGIDGFDAGWESAGQLFDLILETSPHDATALRGRIRVAAHDDDLEFGDALWGRLSEDQRRGLAASQAEADLCRAHARSLDPGEQAPLFFEVIECAISAYSRVLAEAPDRLPALAGMGKTLVLAEHEDPALGISALEHAVVLSPDAPGPRLDLAELLIRSGEASAAIPHLDHVVETYPGSRFAKRARNLRRKAG